MKIKYFVLGILLSLFLSGLLSWQAHADLMNEPKEDPTKPYRVTSLLPIQGTGKNIEIMISGAGLNTTYFDLTLPGCSWMKLIPELSADFQLTYTCEMRNEIPSGDYVLVLKDTFSQEIIAEQLVRYTSPFLPPKETDTTIKEPSLRVVPSSPEIEKEGSEFRMKTVPSKEIKEEIKKSKKDLKKKTTKKTKKTVKKPVKKAKETVVLSEEPKKIEASAKKVVVQKVTPPSKKKIPAEKIITKESLPALPWLTEGFDRFALANISSEEPQAPQEPSEPKGEESTLEKIGNGTKEFAKGFAEPFEATGEMLLNPVETTESFAATLWEGAKLWGDELEKNLNPIEHFKEFTGAIKELRRQLNENPEKVKDELMNGTVGGQLLQEQIKKCTGDYKDKLHCIGNITGVITETVVISKGAKALKGAKLVEKSKIVGKKLIQETLEGTTWEKKLEFLFKKAKESEPLLQGVLDDVAEKSKGKAGKADLKKQKTCEKKCQRDYKNDNGEIEVERLTDALRGKVTYDNLDDLYRAVEEIEAHPDVLQITIKDRIKEIKLPSGYRDIQLKVQLKNNFVAEIQLHPDLLSRAGDGIKVPEALLKKLQWSPEDQGLIKKLIEKTEETMLRPEGFMGGDVIAGHDYYGLVRRFDDIDLPAEFLPLRKKLMEKSKTFFDYFWEEFLKSQ